MTPLKRHQIRDHTWITWIQIEIWQIQGKTGMQRPLLHQRGANSAHISAGLRPVAYRICELNMPIIVGFLVADPHVASFLAPALVF